MDHRHTDAFPFPTSESHPSPPPEGAGPALTAAPDPADEKPALDHGIEESFPASDPVSVAVTKVPSCAPRDEQPSRTFRNEQAADLSSILRAGVISGTVASVASTLMLAWRGKSEVGSFSAPTNATSHWVWGRSAFAASTPSWRHPAVGYAIHHGSATFWALLYTWLRGRRRPRSESAAKSLGTAGLATATAFAIDYAATPKRLTPGFEHHLSKRSMVAVYATFAVGLAAGCALALRDRRSSTDTSGQRVPASPQKR